MSSYLNLALWGASELCLRTLTHDGMCVRGFFRVDEPMMVVSLDGGLHAVNPVTKKTLWSFESGPKLATTFKARMDKEGRDINASVDDLGGDGEEWSIFPGPDGNLYIKDEGGIKVRDCIS